MKSIIDDINECGREYRPSPTRLGIYRDKPLRRRTWRSVALEMLLCFVGCFIGLCLLYVLVGGAIGFVVGCFDSLNVLIGKFMGKP